MKPLLRALALGVGPLVVAATVSTGLLIQLPYTMRHLVAPPSPSVGQCSQPPKFKIGYQARPGYVVPKGNGFRFLSTSWVETNLCSAGVLKITANGELGGAEEPQLSIILGDSLLGNFAFGKTKAISVPIPQPGYLRLGYFNDYYAVDARVATFRAMQFNGVNCRGFTSVDVSKSIGSSWNPETMTARLVRAGSMILVPCSAGLFSSDMEGVKGDGKFPIVRITQNDTLDELIQTRTTPTHLEFSTTSEPIEVALQNAYFDTAVDRNLDVNSIEFSPE